MKKKLVRISVWKTLLFSPIGIWEDSTKLSFMAVLCESGPNCPGCGYKVQIWVLWQYCVRVVRIVLAVDTNQLLVLINTAVGRRSPHIAARFLSG
jgi:hypothetical protein